MELSKEQKAAIDTLGTYHLAVDTVKPHPIITFDRTAEPDDLLDWAGNLFPEATTYLKSKSRGEGEIFEFVQKSYNKVTMYPPDVEVNGRFLAKKLPKGRAQDGILYLCESASTFSPSPSLTACLSVSCIAIPKSVYVEWGTPVITRRRRRVAIQEDEEEDEPKVIKGMSSLFHCIFIYVLI